MKLPTSQNLPAGPDAGGISARHNSIGALRLLLAVLVLYTHAFYLGGFGPEPLDRWSHGTMTAGQLAVQCFFVLSGWLVAVSWCRQPHLGRFAWNRLLRLAPGMWACLLVTAFLFTPLLWLDGNKSVPFFSLEPGAWGYVWHNLVLPRSQIAIGYLPDRGAWPGDWNGSLWTLFYEGACYLMIAGLGLFGLLTRWKWTGTALIASLILLHFGTLSGVSGYLPRFYDTPGKQLTLHFLAGAAWAVGVRNLLPGFFSAWLVLGLALLLVTSWHFRIHPWISPLILPPVLLWIAHREWLSGFEGKVGGDYSYGIYVYGYPVQQVLAHFQVPQHGFTVYLGAGFTLALACAALSWHLVEKPALTLKSLARPRLFPIATA